MAISRRQFIATTGCAVGGALAHPVASGADAAAATPALTLTCTNYVRFMPIATGDVRPKALSLTWVRSSDRNEMRPSTAASRRWRST
jgi:hypothetical protein